MSAKRNYYSEERVVREATFLLKGHTLDEVAMVFNMPKSTVWDHMNKRLPNIDHSLYKQVRQEIDRHWGGVGSSLF